MRERRSAASRIWADRAFTVGVVALAAIGMAPLALIFVFVLVRGASAIDWSFLTGLPRPVGEPGGGVVNAIVDTGIVVALAAVIAVPLGVLAGIFLAESRRSAIAPVTRLAVEVLMGLPSIVIGIIAWLWVVRPLGGFSGFSGGVALSMIMLPIVTLATEETVRMVPLSLREASLALGVSYHRTVLKLILPAAASGIVTGVLLAAARAMGETAPLLLPRSAARTSPSIRSRR